MYRQLYLRFMHCIHKHNRYHPSNLRLESTCALVAVVVACTKLPNHPVPVQPLLLGFLVILRTTHNQPTHKRKKRKRKKKLSTHQPTRLPVRLACCSCSCLAAVPSCCAASCCALVSKWLAPNLSPTHRPRNAMNSLTLHRRSQAPRHRRTPLPPIQSQTNIPQTSCRTPPLQPYPFIAHSLRKPLMMPRTRPPLSNHHLHSRWSN